ncbi:MAG: DUF1295 domain-containing protein [Thermoanaerobaculia bacterium]|nr:DUF1295 domain-containing protein [Thermoanaerobaculia bacterium]
MPEAAEVALIGLGVVSGGMTLVWAASLIPRDVGVVDVFWSLGFVLLAWLYRALFDFPQSERAVLVPILVTVWGVRLALHLARRWWRADEEDHRYAAMRRKRGGSFWWRSLYVVFWSQAALLWVVAMPLLQIQRVARPVELGWLDWVGIVVFAIGFVFESVGDYQLQRFKSDPANDGEVMDEGLWRYTRHPNYFGDAMVWWGLSLMALATPGSVWVLVGTAVMTLLLLRVSGVALLERDIAERRPEYEAYKRRTNAFFPWLPSSEA